MIKISGLNFAYKAGVPIISDFTLSLERGHIYGLLGRNGTGKSTLLKLISGLVFPKSGEVMVNGRQPLNREPSFLRDIYYLQEEMESPKCNILDYAKYYSPFYPNFSFDDLNKMIDEFQIDTKQKIVSMSLGQKKKVFIAFAVATNCAIILMDEPTNGLDIPSKSQFRRVISKMATEERTFIISTHQVRDLDNLIDSIIIIDDNRLMISASTYEIGNRLLFKVLGSGEEALYSEDSMRGEYGVVLNRDGEDSRVDIELLFNAVVSNSKGINDIFKK